MKTLDRFEFMRLFVRIAESAVSPRPLNRLAYPSLPPSRS
jgi:hypothetical protein